MPRKVRLSAVLEQHVVPAGPVALEAFTSIKELGAKYPAVHEAVLADADHRHIGQEKALEIARTYVELRVGESEEPEFIPAAFEEVGTPTK